MDVFKAAHSVRSVATSAAAKAGTTTSADILKAADWSSESVFQKFYYKLENKDNFAKLPTTNQQ